MQVFSVGGAVRDELLGLPVQDRDWVVIGATPEQMQAQGFRAVGKDFPVFLHPQTHEEYALARTERKTAPGYKGFAFHASPDVTLEQDLARRDLTINAIAKRADGAFIDPYGGRRDLEARVLRHVSPAFAEDPVRILRLARFAARFADFDIAAETLDLMQQMVAAGEVDHLVPERVWQELGRGLMEARPSRMFEALRACGALKKILPEVDALWGVPQRADHHPEIDTGIHVMLVLDMSARLDTALAVRFAALTHDLGKGVTGRSPGRPKSGLAPRGGESSDQLDSGAHQSPADVLPRHPGHEQHSVRLLGPLCERLRVPADCRDLALLVARFHGDIGRVNELRPATVVKILESCDAIRRPERFEQILLACEADSRGRTGYEERPFLAATRWRALHAAARDIDAAGIAKQCKDPAHIAAAIHEARIGQVKATVDRFPATPASTTP